MKFSFEFRFFCQNFTWKKGSAPHHVPWTIEKEPPEKGQSKNKTSLVPPPLPPQRLDFT